MTSSDPYDPGIIAKLERAHELVLQLQAEQLRWRGAGPDVREYESRSNQQDSSNPLVRMEWRLTKAPEPIPLSFAALLGDVIQNYRASLDYATWAAASDNARDRRPSQVQFPLRADAREFGRWLQDRDGWFSSDAIAVMEASQPYHAQPDQLHPLRVLQVLSNTDKHRLLNVVDQAHINLGVFLNPMPSSYEWSTADGPVEVGETLATLSFPRPALSGHLDVMPVFGWYESVSFEEAGAPTKWLKIDALVNSINRWTVDTVGMLSGARHQLQPPANS